MRLLVPIVCFTVLAAQDPTFHSTTALVRIDAEAIDPNGRVIPNLAQSDFRVLDQGVPRSLVNFEFEVEPLDLILLFDVSSGMREKIHSIIRATELGFHELREGDRVSVLSYDSQTHPAQDFTSDLNAVNEAILLRVVASHFGGSAHIETAAAEAAVRFRAEPPSHRKRAILAITDKLGGPANVRDLWTSDVVFSELIVGKGGETRLLDAGANSIVDRTGGAAIAAGVPGEAFQESVHYVRSGYTMYYALPEAGPDAAHGSERTVRVELTPDAVRRYPGVRIRARSGYVAP
jgi:hypothetical protein